LNVWPLPDELPVMVYIWGNNPRRAELKGRRCVVLARGAMGSVLVQFLDTGEKVVTSRRAVRRDAGAVIAGPAHEVRASGWGGDDMEPSREGQAC
jgi:hypothetical protein